MGWLERPRAGAELVQCAGDVYGRPWQEVRRVEVTHSPLLGDEVTGKVYRQGRSGKWDEYIAEIPVPKSTLQGDWAAYQEWRADEV